MSQAIMLPDDLYRALAAYAAQRRQTPEEAIAALVRNLPAEEHPPTSRVNSAESTQNDSEAPSTRFDDPWQGFYGAFESNHPDLSERHDYYMGQKSLHPRSPR
ncbi:MAG TPA: hypothetical protein VFQ32_03340 [Ktedonobacterales bacterium]|nr:hypothetical protein [Ktedonobacterales bacterium]